MKQSYHWDRDNMSLSVTIVYPIEWWIWKEHQLRGRESTISWHPRFMLKNNDHRIWEGPGTENTTIITSQPTVRATQLANVIVPESTDMRFSPEPLNETPSRNTGEQLTVNSKKVAKNLPKWKQQHSHFCSKRVQQHQQHMPVYRLFYSVWKKHLVSLLFDWSFFRVPLLCVACSKSFWKATRKKCAELLKLELQSKRNSTKSEGSY